MTHTLCAPQLRNSGVLDITEDPEWDEDMGVLAGADNADEEIEIELNEAEPHFLKGHTTRSGLVLSPIKVIRAPDGSLQNAALTQQALAKERRELREQQRNQLLDSIPKDLNRPWVDPMPEHGERQVLLSGGCEMVGRAVCLCRLCGGFAAVGRGMHLCRLCVGCDGL